MFGISVAFLVSMPPPASLNPGDRGVFLTDA